MRIEGGKVAVLDERSDHRPVVVAFVGTGEQRSLLVECDCPFIAHVGKERELRYHRHPVLGDRWTRSPCWQVRNKSARRDSVVDLLNHSFGLIKATSPLAGTRKRVMRRCHPRLSLGDVNTPWCGETLGASRKVANHEWVATSHGYRASSLSSHRVGVRAYAVGYDYRCMMVFRWRVKCWGDQTKAALPGGHPRRFCKTDDFRQYRQSTPLTAFEYRKHAAG